jgi:hypothetical protein
VDDDGLGELGISATPGSKRQRPPSGARQRAQQPAPLAAPPDRLPPSPGRPPHTPSAAPDLPPRPAACAAASALGSARPAGSLDLDPTDYGDRRRNKRKVRHEVSAALGAPRPGRQPASPPSQRLLAPGERTTGQCGPTAPLTRARAPKPAPPPALQQAVRDFEDDDYVPGRNKELAQKLGGQKLPRTGLELAKEVADPRSRKKLGGRQGGMGRDGRGGVDARMLQLQQLNMRRAPPQPNMPPNWTQEDDSLLCAITNEFGQNWSLVSDVLSSTCAMQGVHRKPEWCRARYQMLSKPEGALLGARPPAFLCCMPFRATCLATAQRAAAVSWSTVSEQRSARAPQVARKTAARGSSRRLRR